MKKIILCQLAVMLLACKMQAAQADQTDVRVVSQTAGATPFISLLTVGANDVDALRRVQFTVLPKPRSVTRPLSSVYTMAYLDGRGYVHKSAGEFVLPVFGLYSGFENTVSLNYFFSDGSVKTETIKIATAAFEHVCDFDSPKVFQARTRNTELSFDYMIVGTACTNHCPIILDTDGAVRWVGTVGSSNHAMRLYDNAVYQPHGTQLFRNELDGTVTLLADYRSRGVTGFHHNIDIGREGLIVDVDTDKYVESVNLEVDPEGNVLRSWAIGDIISAAMRNGGDDPSQFVKTAKGRYDFEAPEDWFHNNSTTYRKADDTLLVSSRENFVIALDYDTKQLKWIFGDKSKQWYQFPSLQRFALQPGPDTLPPDGQHALSIASDGNLLLLDNGRQSEHHSPRGPNRYSAARKYSLDLTAKVATQVWQYPENSQIFTPVCSSIYEDQPLNYLVDYSVVGGFSGSEYAELIGLTPSGQKVFDYGYRTYACEDAYRALPVHLERVVYDLAQPVNANSKNLRLANVSARCSLQGGDDVAIAGFIITGNQSKHVIVRALGPSLPLPISSVVNDPTLELHDAAGNLIEFNNNWTTGPRVDAIRAAGLDPHDERESAIERELAPGKYTAIVRGLNRAAGISLLEVYDTTPDTDSKLGNISARSFVSSNDKVLIGGVIVRGSFPKQVLFRAVGPSLHDAGVANALGDPTLALYNADGAMISSNDNWQEAPNANRIQASGLAPTKPAEAVILIPLNAGNYTATVRSAHEGSAGTALVEAYQLD